MRRRISDTPGTCLWPGSICTEVLQPRAEPGAVGRGGRRERRRQRDARLDQGTGLAQVHPLDLGRVEHPLVRGEDPAPAPRASALGSLVHYITHAEPKNFQPANITFDLLESLEEETRKKVRDKKERHRIQCDRALAAFDGWMSGAGTADGSLTIAETTAATPAATDVPG